MPPHPDCDKVHVGCCLIVTRMINGIEYWCMIKRKGAHGSNTWSVPGGWMEQGEWPQATVLREFMEELGTEMSFLSPIFVGVTNDLGEEIHSVTLWHKTTYVSGEPRNMEPEKIEEIQWIPTRDLPFMKLFRPLEIFLTSKILVS
jgi:8-oxo-dGTP diphosphatase